MRDDNSWAINAINRFDIWQILINVKGLLMSSAGQLYIVKIFICICIDKIPVHGAELSVYALVREMYGCTVVFTNNALFLARHWRQRTIQTRRSCIRSCLPHLHLIIKSLSILCWAKGLLIENYFWSRRVADLWWLAKCLRIDLRWMVGRWFVRALHLDSLLRHKIVWTSGNLVFV